MGKVIYVLFGKGYPCELEKLFPTDPLDPLSNPLVLLRICDVGLKDHPHGGRYFRPPGGIVLDEGNGELGELRLRPEVTHLSANHDGNAIVLGIMDLDGRADGEAVTAVHALVLVDLDALLCRIRADGACGASSDR